MRYISTRGKSPPKSFADVLLAGLAPDGGLYMPEAWPSIGASEIAGFAGMHYAEVARSVIAGFVGDAIPIADLRADIGAAYAAFAAPEIAPLVEIDRDLYLMELFHGPTLAFKDIAMQLLGRLYARELARRQTRATIVVATSGDTGSAAIAAFGGLPNIALFVLHPKDRVSEVQRRQMTTAPHDNVHNIALEGSFDDAQALVKRLFADTAFAECRHLTAVNSINFVRIAAQCVYYFTAAAPFEGRRPRFIVPTGNFGDAFAGDVAARMGLDIRPLAIATNANDILVRALDEGVYAAGATRQTLSPSMDIQVASNFERALFEASGRDAAWLADAMDGFAAERRLVIPPAILDSLRTRYSAKRCGDDETLETIGAVYRKSGRLIDPHTAVAVFAAQHMGAGSDNPRIILSTAHSAKFPEAVERATGQRPPLPDRLHGLYVKAERATVLPRDEGRLRDFIEDRLAHS
jgi:threonine synthase